MQFHLQEQGQLGTETAVQGAVGLERERSLSFKTAVEDIQVVRRSLFAAAGLNAVLLFESIYILFRATFGLLQRGFILFPMIKFQSVYKLYGFYTTESQIN